MRGAAMACLGVAAYAVFLAAGMPANFIAARANAAAPGTVELAEPRGTLWSGSASARIRAPGGDVLLDRVEWHLLPMRLAEGRIAFDVSASGRGVEARGEVARGFSAWEVRNAIAHLAADAFTPLAPMLAAWRPEGRVDVSSSLLAWNDASARGDLRAEWKDAGLALSDVHPLGSYRVDFHGDGGPARVTVTTLEGALAIALQGTLAPPSTLDLAGEARGQGPSAAALEPLLNLMGPRRPDGARALEIKLR